MESKVRVIVRTRPFLQEGINPSESCVKQTQKNTIELSNLVSKTESINYKFDACYSMDSTQEEIYKEIEGSIPDVLKGINTTIFAYGMTGAGKTHTMQGSPSEPGIIPRVGQYIMELTNLSSSTPNNNNSKNDQKKINNNNKNNETRYEVFVSYLEIYNEKVFDLLEPKDEDLTIRQGNNGEIIIPGLCKSKVESFDQFQKTYQTGCKNRTVAQTSLNKTSSRSHAILCIYVHTILSDKIYAGKLHLIDLAGSEDNRHTNNRGMRMTESSNINSSLFVLGKVVNALNEGGAARIPYRDSKLTRLIQDSLGGQSNAIMIANVAPENHFYAETVRTLNFASKSKKIVNKPIVNIEKTAEQIRYEEEKKRKLLEMQRAKLKKKRNSIEKFKQLKQKQMRLNERDRGNNSSMDEFSPLQSDSFFSCPSEQITADVIEQEVKRRLNEEKKALLSPWLKQQAALENKLDRLERLEKAIMEAKDGSDKKRMKIKKSSEKQYKSMTLESDDETDSDYSNNEDEIEEDDEEMELINPKKRFFSNLKKNDGDKENLANNKRKKITKGKTVLASPVSPRSLLLQSPNSLNLLSPDSKNTTIKEFLLKGREQERLGNLSVALTLYTTARNLLPLNNEKLEKKIRRLQAKIPNTETEKANGDENEVSKSNTFTTTASGRNRILEILNKGGEKELCQLHTVGTKRAKLIIQFRKEKPYDSFDDLKRAGFTAKILDTFLKQNVLCFDE